MDLFNKPKAKKQKVVKQPEPQPEPVPEEVIQEEPSYLEPEEETQKVDRVTAETNFKVAVRNLNEFEKQIKTGKPTMVDENKRDKIPSILSIVNSAELTKLNIKDHIEAFKNAGYTDENINILKQKALEPKEYVFYTL